MISLKRLVFGLNRLGLLSCFAAGCAGNVDTKWVKPLQDENRPVIHYLTFAGANAIGFTAPDGKSCQVHALRPKGHGMFGWQADDSDDPACTHDTLYEGVNVAALELHWRGRIPRDGSYELNTFGYTLHTTGAVIVRGSWNLDTWSVTNLVVEMKSDHCSMEWSTPVASAVARGPWMRKTPFYGYQEIPPLQMDDCKAGDMLEVTARLAAESNRGRIDIDSFGFFAASDSDAQQLLALIPKAERLPADHKDTAACAHWTGQFCATPYEKRY
jgi:hypothetical protein